MIIYHITTLEAWEEAQKCGHYEAPSLRKEGFIHASTREQVSGTANVFFQGQDGLLLLVIESDKLSASVRFDPVISGRELKAFPHIYGPINLNAVIKTVEYSSGQDGIFPSPPFVE